jgi:mRNA interferase RelE/StbE
VPDYSITLARSARKDLERLPRQIALRALAAIELLARQPRPVGCRKIQAASNLWRVRVGDYRVVYSILDTERTVDITAVRHRRDAYRS